MSFIEVYREIRINSKLAEEKYFLDDGQKFKILTKRTKSEDAQIYLKDIHIYTSQYNIS